MSYSQFCFWRRGGRSLSSRYRPREPWLLLIAKFEPVHTQVIAAYGLAWLLLLSGVRTVVEHGPRAGDALILRDATHIPRLLWSLLWLGGTLAALAIGGRMLVMGG